MADRMCEDENVEKKDQDRTEREDGKTENFTVK